MTRGMFIKY